MEKRIDIAKPYLGDEELEAILEPLRSGWVTQGPMVRQFEEEFAEVHDSNFAIATTSCTAALHLILLALDVGKGDEVILPSFTWISCANVVVHCGATPVLVDVAPGSFNIDPDKIKDAISPSTKAIMAVHLFGECAQIDAIKSVCGNIPIIEDAACAVGAKFQNRAAGAHGIAGAFSFHPRKIVTTGEGGMITTQSEKFAERLRTLRDHGASISDEQRHHGPAPYLLPEFKLAGLNYRMTDMQGALGVCQLKRLETLRDERARAAERYCEALTEVKWLETPEPPSECLHSWQAFVCRVRPDQAPVERNQIMLKLQEAGISTRPGTHAIHMQEYYRSRYQFEDSMFPASRACAEQSLALPLHNHLKNDDYDYIIDTLKSI